jgi:alkanesulfonate monooxygenase SsuD/methylene tetrahydromethanopterin reductase-like flavin-dependent oxidoreductase (luciferase family)
MRLGVAIPLLALPEGRYPVPRWEDIHTRARTAEEVGFDLVVLEDALSWPLDEVTGGAWESIALLGGLATATSTIRLGHSVINAPYRAPGLVAKAAETLDEMSGGRYVLGIGAGNTPDADYRAFGIPADHRYTRFVEGLEIIHDLLKRGEASLAGRFHAADGAQLVLRGPREQGPPIVVAAGGPRMKRAAARFADEWNWWTGSADDLAALPAHLDDLDRACEEIGRDPATLRRSLDVYFPVVEGDPSDDEVAARLLSLEELGIEEVRCYLPKQTTHAANLAEVTAMAGVVERVHRG